MKLFHWQLLSFAFLFCQVSLANQGLVVYASKGKTTELEKELKKNPSHCEFKTDNHNTLLHIAAHKGKTSIVKIIISCLDNIGKKKAKQTIDAMNSDDTTALMFAVQGGHIDVTLELLNAGADTEKKNSKGSGSNLLRRISTKSRIL